MKTSTSINLNVSGRRANLPVTVIAVILSSLALGITLTDSSDEMIAYLLVTLACAAPIAYWIYAGAKGIPVMPAIAAMHFIYFGVPILQSNATEKLAADSSEILVAAATVALFLLVATISWAFLLILGVRRSNDDDGQEPISEAALKRFIFLGLVLGAVYFIALYAGALTWLGPSLGLFRSIALTSAAVACFAFGHALARGWLRGRDWILAVGSFGALVILSVSSLLLVTGVMFCLAAAFGYVITSKRVPWILFAVAAAIVMVLQAGKEEMRTKYWPSRTEFSAEMSLAHVPSLMVEWVEAGVGKIVSGGQYDSAIDRASLLGLLVRAQRLAPDFVPYLDGKTYTVLPEMLIPRFISENKIASQAAMDMLNIHFGVLTGEGTKETAVGWGLIAEGYANFGYLGVIVVGFVLGIFSGFFERWSDGAPLMSLPAFMAIATMNNLINMEGDAAGILTSLFQSLVAISIMFWLVKLLSKNRRSLNNRTSGRNLSA